MECILFSHCLYFGSCMYTRLTSIRFKISIEKMLMRSLLIFILFILNFVATTLAESNHISIDFHPDISSHIENHVKKGHNQKHNKSPEHCEEHRGCHSSHFYLFLSSCREVYINSLIVLNSNFLESSLLYDSVNLDLNKPPIV